MENVIIFILAFILIILVILNFVHNIKYIYNNPSSSECYQTAFGCCPNGVDSKINFYGTNCTAYKSNNVIIKPLPPPPQPLPPPPHPIYGGCAGTRYGCCPNNVTAKFDSQGTNCLIK